MQMALKFVSNLNSYTLLAVPFFILMGELMSAGGITDTLIAFSKELVGWMRGGAAMVNVVASFFFGGISGSSSADCASLGPIEIKMMEEQGYDREFSTCLTMASSVEGILVPPSQNMVIFTLAAAGVTTVSIGQLFVAGYMPGAVLSIVLMIYSYYYSQEDEHPGHRQVQPEELHQGVLQGHLGHAGCYVRGRRRYRRCLYHHRVRRCCRCVVAVRRPVHLQGLLLQGYPPTSLQTSWRLWARC